MKKSIVLALAAMIMVGCKEIETKKINEIQRNTLVVTIDSCQYVVGNSGGCGYYIYTHHNNCRFCKERRQKEMKEIVEELKGK